MPNHSKRVIALPELDAAMCFALREVLAFADEQAEHYARQEDPDGAATICAGGGGPTYGEMTEALESLALAIRHTLAGAAPVTFAPADDGTG